MLECQVSTTPDFLLELLHGVLSQGVVTPPEMIRVRVIPNPLGESDEDIQLMRLITPSFSWRFLHIVNIEAIEAVEIDGVKYLQISGELHDKQNGLVAKITLLVSTRWGTSTTMRAVIVFDEDTDMPDELSAA